ncbi:MAG: 3-oxoadipate enol-lactonase 2 [Paracidovorax wautersii]|uniref:3-oxoadipate enol-lactonase 2 n=1 Tax=Paracidovorax wautersii TaxID=1177982 RepID=A0A7V8JNV4_9BURK|nr:MAG: 3-oxoadipate enol-lactonase 2 [Paracidovorax wautersii]
MTTDLHWAHLDGISIRYTDNGKQGRPLLLLHEMGGSLESWGGVLAALPPRQRIIRCDMRGAGGSEKIRREVSCDVFADDVAKLLDHLKVPEADVAGVAIGGCIGLNLAARYPARVKKLVPINPPTDAAGRAGEVLRERARLTDEQGMRGVVDAALARSYPELLRGDRQAYDAYVARFITNDPTSYAHVLRALLAVDFTPLWSLITAPVLFAAGTHDLVRTPAATKAAAGQVPRADFLEIEGGHIPSVQAPDALARILVDYFELHA